MFQGCPSLQEPWDHLDYNAAKLQQVRAWFSGRMITGAPVTTQHSAVAVHYQWYSAQNAEHFVRLVRPDVFLPFGKSYVYLICFSEI